MPFDEKFIILHSNIALLLQQWFLRTTVPTC